jgi:hypothetical protein
MKTSERHYMELMFRSSNKYAAWDPEIEIKVGDFGHITQGRRRFGCWRKPQGVFMCEGNIYDNGLAKKRAIPEPKEFGGSATKGVTWIVSDNAEETDGTLDVSAYVLFLALTLSCLSKVNAMLR